MKFYVVFDKRYYEIERNAIVCMIIQLQHTYVYHFQVNFKIDTYASDNVNMFFDNS